MKTYYAKPNGTVHGLNKGNVYHFKSEEWEKLKQENKSTDNLILEIYDYRKKEWIKAGIQDFTIIPCVFNK